MNTVDVIFFNINGLSFLKRYVVNTNIILTDIKWIAYSVLTDMLVWLQHHNKCLNITFALLLVLNEHYLYMQIPCL